jgi:hypothetical protein
VSADTSNAADGPWATEFSASDHDEPEAGDSTTAPWDSTDFEIRKANLAQQVGFS